MTYTVVLTGGIAAGKTAVSDRFAERGAAVIDTDVIAREVVEPGQPALELIRQQFGPSFLTEDGYLDRRRMREAIFTDSTLRKKLESILHPAISKQVQKQIARVGTAYCILVIPLYTGNGGYDWVDRVLVVDVAEDIQLERVMQRDNINRQQAQAILRAQLSRKQRRLLAHDLIDNSADLEALDAQVEALHQRYLALAAAQH